MASGVLPIGSVLDEPLFDADGVLLLDSGMVLTTSFVASLHRRGIRWIRLGMTSELSRVQKPFARTTSDTGSDTFGSNIQNLLEVVSKRLGQEFANRVDRDAIPLNDFSPGAVERISDHLHQSLGVLENSLRNIRRGDTEELTSLQESTLNNMMLVSTDADLALFASTVERNPQHSDFHTRLNRHCLNTAILALATGIEAELSIIELLHLGTAALLCDLALYESRPDLIFGQVAHNVETKEQIRLHPQVAFERLAKLKSVPGPVLLAIRHHHEMLDGSGFPFGLTGERISSIAKILCLTHAFLEITEPLDGSPGILPADAAAYLVHHAIQGRFCIKVTQSFLRVMSVYPIGSMVSLSDNRQATVVRTSRTHPMRPIVRTDEGLIDLRKADCSIVSPIPAPHLRQERLPTSRFAEPLWLRAD